MLGIVIVIKDIEVKKERDREIERDREKQEEISLCAHGAYFLDKWV